MDIFRITKSQARQKILQLFFSDINKRYYLREMERILNLSAGNIRRELLSLVKSGIFQREKAGNQMYYFLNQSFPVFDEVKNIVIKTIGLVGILKAELNTMKNIEMAFIYGSFARQKEDSFSDVDVMIIGNPNESVLVKGIGRVEKKINREVNYNIFSARDFRQAVSQKEVFLEEIISSPKIFLTGDAQVLEKIIGRRPPGGKDRER